MRIGVRILTTGPTSEPVLSGRRAPVEQLRRGHSEPQSWPLGPPTRKCRRVVSHVLPAPATRFVRQCIYPYFIFQEAISPRHISHM